MSAKVGKHEHIYNEESISTDELEFRRNLYPEVSVIEGRRVQCSVCLKDIKHIILYKRKAYVHKHLKVLLCKDCHHFYDDGEFSVDEDGLDKYCRWCGQGGQLYMCSDCPCAFCKKCIKQNLARRVLNEIEDDDWKCFMCVKKPLFELRALCWAVVEHISNKKKILSKKAVKSKEARRGTSIEDFCKQLPTRHFRSKQLLIKGKNWLKEFRSDISYFGTTLTKRIDTSVKSHSKLENLSDVNTTIKDYIRVIEQSLETFNEFNKSLLNFQKNWEKLLKEAVQKHTIEKNIEVINVDDDVNTESASENCDAVGEIRVNCNGLQEASLKSYTNTKSKIKTKTKDVDRSVVTASVNTVEVPKPETAQSGKSSPESDKRVLDEEKAITETIKPLKPLLRIKNVDELNDISKSVVTPDKDSSIVSEDNNTDKLDDSVSIIPASDSENESSTVKEKESKPPDKVGNNEVINNSVKSTEKKDSNDGIVFDGVLNPSEEPLALTCESDNSLSEKEGRESATDHLENVTVRKAKKIDTVEPNDKIINSDTEMDSRAAEDANTKSITKNESSGSKNKEVQQESSSDSSDETLFSSDSSEDIKAVKKRTPGKRKRLTSDSSSSETKKVTTRPKKSLDIFNESSSDTSFSLSFVKKEKRVNKMKDKKDKVEDSDEQTEKAAAEPQTFFSDSEDDLRKLLDLNSLNKKRKHSNSESDTSGTRSKENAAKNKRQPKLSKKELSLLDCLEGSDGEDNKVESCNMENLQLPSLRLKYNDFSLARDLLDNMSHSDAEINNSSESTVLVEDDTEKPAKKKYTKKKSNSDDNAETKSSSANRLKRDKLLNMKLTETDSSEAEERWRKHKQREEAKKSEEVNKKKTYRKTAKLFTSDSSDDCVIEGNSIEEDVQDDKTESDIEKTPPNKNRRRRRIKTQSSTSSGSDDDKEGTKVTDSAGKGRKNIRKVLKEENLKESTQNALKEEQERKKRIMEKQTLYNQFVSKAEDVGEVKAIEEVVLDYEPKTKKTLLALDKNLVKKLKPHQAEGIKFMWDSCFESLEDAKKKRGSGCILAHCMGLGKSLQVVSLLHALLTNEDTDIKTALVVCPVSTVLNWVNEFDKWLKDVGSGQDIEVYHMAKTQTSYRVFQLKDWQKSGGIMILGYNLYRILANEKIKVKASAKAVYRQTLVDPGPDIVICDEGHLLKNEATALSVAMNKIKTRRRIVLTGTPLQNNLVEYHCMVQFVKPNLLGTKKEFKNRFVNPIQNGQFEDSTTHDVKLMKRRAHVLHTMLDGIVQRKDYSVLTPYLPPKFEYVIHLKMSDLQCTLYQHYLDNEAKRKLFVDFQSLMRICIHPQALLMKSEKDQLKEEIEAEESEGSLKDFIDDGSDKGSETSSSSSLASSNSDSDTSIKEDTTSRRRTRNSAQADEVEEPEAQQKKIEWWTELVDEEQLEDIRQGTKIFLFFVILKFCEEIGDKLLVFSQSLFTLDIIEYFLNKIDDNSQKSDPDPNLSQFGGSWAKGLDYFRMDGGSSFDHRHAWCKAFNNERNSRGRLFLISTRAGGLGINLTGANRVIIFDASWNPSYDVQSLFRVYRFGQTKPCYIYRFLSKGTMEEKIYERQVAKLSTALRVIDEHQIDRHFSHSALAELYTFDPEGSELRATPVLPKDRLMAELLQSHGDIILSYHQHDSLLENQEDQELTEEERKAAWAEFENEKKPQPQWPNMILLQDVEQRMKVQNPALTDEECKQRALEVFQKYQLLQQQQLQQKFLQMTQHMQQNMAQQSTTTGQIRPLQNWSFPNFTLQQQQQQATTTTNATTGAIFSNNYQPYRFPQGILDKKLQQQPYPTQQINTQTFVVNPKATAAARSGLLGDKDASRLANNHQILKAPPEMSANKPTNSEPIVLNDD
ncbi:uncharacterized protein isoform X3 [Rhodnius prolixus]|uniref:uncharacterized protein isoform X3 n=1 Tax=Rhodnius prolixus TaxID=13249 RepID=UPI003D18C192